MGVGLRGGRKERVLSELGSVSDKGLEESVRREGVGSGKKLRYRGRVSARG